MEIIYASVFNLQVHGVCTMVMKTTPEHFEIFKKECEKWIEIFGLKNWCVRYYHKKDSDSAPFSWTNYTYSGRAVDIFLNKVWADKHNSLVEYELKQSAFHEVCEILLYPVRYLAECRFLTDSEIDPEIHNIIRTLESVLWREELDEQ